jgi:hypothetical protein
MQDHGLESMTLTNPADGTGNFLSMRSIPGLPVAATLLQSLKPNSSGVRQMTARPIDAMMWPFRFGGQPEADEENSANTKNKKKGGKGKGQTAQQQTPAEAQSLDEPTLYEKRMTAVRLLALVSGQDLGTELVTGHG